MITLIYFALAIKSSFLFPRTKNNIIEIGKKIPITLVDVARAEKRAKRQERRYKIQETSDKLQFLKTEETRDMREDRRETREER